MEDKKFMKRCLELASKAEGLTYPNPMVGSVIVHEGKIIGEGFHHKAGEAHAEVNAINSVPDKSKLKYSTLYVNLEPCSHFGRTPPCADFIISNSIPRVVIGSLDTSDKVSGKGMLKLKDAGCEVVSGILEEECRWLNRRFFAFHEKRRPYIILKWAQSADGYLDLIRSSDQNREPNWITGKPERVLVHKWRASEQSILVGGSTMRIDNPKLNVRDWKGANPLRIILSSSGILNYESWTREEIENTVVFTEKLDAVITGVNKVKLEKEIPSSIQVSNWLFNSGIQSVFIEGGTKVLTHFINSGMWDEARIFFGTGYFRDGIKAPLLSGSLISKTAFSRSTLEIYKNESLRAF